MTGPTSDDWDDLARELGVDKSAPPPLPVQHPTDRVEREIGAEALEPHHGTDDRVEEDAVSEGEPEAAGDEEFGDEEGTVVEGELTPEGQPGTGRKRRRRRRRRRKSAAAPAEGGAETVETEAAEEREEDGATSDDVAAEEEFGTEAEGEFAPLAAEEDTASDVLRDLIANWNVPSWDDIVGGLYRPG